jgi:exosortase
MIQLTLFPLSYLFLMIPIPHTAFKAISLRLRLFDAHVAASWVSWLGIPILQDGYLLFLPKVTLEVADGCSGVLSVVSLLAIGILYVHLTQTSWLNKVVLWLSIVPIAIGANIARIVTISVSVYVFGDWILDTFFHELGGTFNFLLGLLSIVLLGAFLTKMFRPRVRAC